MMKDYGKELIIDLHNCKVAQFNRKSIRKYLKGMCEILDMKREKLCWWDDLHTAPEEKETEAHLVGTSVVQFIKTSNITIHTLDLLGKVFINVFSCKEFNEDKVVKFSKYWFDGELASRTVIRRL